MDLTFLKNVLKLFYQSLPFSFQTMTNKLGVLNKTLIICIPVICKYLKIRNV
jgi:hypothetical protein